MERARPPPDQSGLPDRRPAGSAARAARRIAQHGRAGGALARGTRFGSGARRACASSGTNGPATTPCPPAGARCSGRRSAPPRRRAAPSWWSPMARSRMPASCRPISSPAPGSGYTTGGGARPRHHGGDGPGADLGRRLARGGRGGAGARRRHGRERDGCARMGRAPARRARSVPLGAEPLGPGPAPRRQRGAAAGRARASGDDPRLAMRSPGPTCRLHALTVVPTPGVVLLASPGGLGQPVPLRCVEGCGATSRARLRPDRAGALALAARSGGRGRRPGAPGGSPRRSAHPEGRAAGRARGRPRPRHLAVAQRRVRVGAGAAGGLVPPGRGPRRRSTAPSPVHRSTRSHPPCRW